MEIIFRVFVIAGVVLAVSFRAHVAKANRDGYYAEDLENSPVDFFRYRPKCNETNVSNTGNGYLWQCSDCKYSYEPNLESRLGE
jgi:hypothetical protein